MKIIRAFPPNYAAINKKFNVRGKPVIFCLGATIFNPSNIEVGPLLLVHEQVHSDRQGADPMAWWDRYLEEPEFRFDEELPAHRAEYQEAARRYDGKALGTALHRMAIRLSSPLYGSMTTYDEARRAIAAL